LTVYFQVKSCFQPEPCFMYRPKADL